jgi:hypothetical protein
MKPTLKYSYLGPNCCRFGEMVTHAHSLEPEVLCKRSITNTATVSLLQVLRSYDTRLRATQRRPLLYLAQDEARKSVIFPREDVAQTVLSVPNDATNALEFGDPLPEDFELHRRDWLWTGQGKLLVIRTRYRHGRHYAEKPTDFLPIIEHLEYLHGKEYVHGDIRAFNMVFGGSTEARVDPVRAAVGTANDGSDGFVAEKGSLIDFDFGGEQGEMTKYPQGYKQYLPDGLRIGQEGKVIQYKDDWHDLGQVIFTCHGFCPPAVLRQGKQQELSQKEAAVRGLLFRIDDSTRNDMIVKLKNFLRDAEKAGYNVQRSHVFTQCFSSLENPGTADTAMATGSPPNAK